MMTLLGCTQLFDSKQSNTSEKQHSHNLPKPVSVEDKWKSRSGIEFEHFDTSVRPQDDLFRYVNGKWLDSFEIPADKSNYGVFSELAEKSRNDVKAIIEQASEEPTENGSDSQKVGDLYLSFMNRTQLNKLATTPLYSEIEKIESIENLSDLSEYLAYAQLVTRAPFYVWVGTDSKSPDKYITRMGQSGLGLPNRSFYLKKDEKSQKIRQQYIKHIAEMFDLIDSDDPIIVADFVMSLEMQLAENQWTKEKIA